MQQIVWLMFLRKQVPLGMKVWWCLLLLKKKTCYTLVRKCRWSHTSPRQNTTTDHHHDHSTAQNGTPQHHNHTTTTPLHHLHTRRPLSVHLTRIQVHHTHTHTHRPQTPSPGGAAWRSGLASKFLTFPEHHTIHAAFSRVHSSFTLLMWPRRSLTFAPHAWLPGKSLTRCNPRLPKPRTCEGALQFFCVATVRRL